MTALQTLNPGRRWFSGGRKRVLRRGRWRSRVEGASYGVQAVEGSGED